MERTGVIGVIEDLQIGTTQDRVHHLDNEAGVSHCPDSSMNEEC